MYVEVGDPMMQGGLPLRQVIGSATFEKMGHPGAPLQSRLRSHPRLRVVRRTLVGVLEPAMVELDYGRVQR